MRLGLLRDDHGWMDLHSRRGYGGNQGQGDEFGGWLCLSGELERCS
jgi:hypothetical protein